MLTFADGLDMSVAVVPFSFHPDVVNVIEVSTCLSVSKTPNAVAYNFVTLDGITTEVRL